MKRTSRWLKMVSAATLAAQLTLGQAFAQQQYAPGDYERYRVGDYVMPTTGEQTVTFTIRLLKERGWDIVSVSPLVLPAGYVLTDGTVLTQATVVVDILVRRPPAIPVVQMLTIPASTGAACFDYDPFTAGVQGPFPNARCNNGGWS